MKITVNRSRFIDEFNDSSRAGTFSNEGLNALFDYLEELDEDYELDIVALCCDYAEDTYDGIADNYGLDLSSYKTREDRIEAVKEYLEEHTSIVLHDDEGFVYAQF